MLLNSKCRHKERILLPVFCYFIANNAIFSYQSVRNVDRQRRTVIISLWYNSGKQCLGAPQPVFRSLGESPKPQICSFGQATRFVNADILMEGWRVSLHPLPAHQSENRKFAHTGLVKSRVGDCHACLKTAKAPARMPLASARALATWWA